MTLSQKIDAVKAYLLHEESALLSNQFKIHTYVPVNASILAELTGPHITDVEVGISRLGEEWHICISYKEKELKRTYAVKNMSAYALLDTYRNLDALKQAVKERRAYLHIQYTEIVNAL